VTTEQDGPQRGLRANAIGLGGDVIVAVANVAPSSAVAFTLALLLTLTGLASPLIVLLVGLLMLCVTLGYAAMNRWNQVEYSVGTPIIETCVDALMPHFGYVPCWYLRRHTIQQVGNPCGWVPITLCISGFKW